MIVNRLDELMKNHGVTPTDIHKQTKISRNTIYLLKKKSTNSIDFSTLDKLCTFFGCTPNDILEYTPE